nr:MAG TPA: hypothetical protein [Caudoviricetes sp.]
MLLLILQIGDHETFWRKVHLQWLFSFGSVKNMQRVFSLITYLIHHIKNSPFCTKGMDHRKRCILMGYILYTLFVCAVYIQPHLLAQFPQNDHTCPGQCWVH